jgi:hypothetical protein
MGQKQREFPESAELGFESKNPLKRHKQRTVLGNDEPA